MTDRETGIKKVDALGVPNDGAVPDRTHRRGRDGYHR